MIGRSDERKNVEEEKRDKGAERAVVGDDTRRSWEIKYHRIPMSAALLFKKYLPTGCEQFMGNTVKILLERIPVSGIATLKAKLEKSRNNRQQESIPNRKMKFTFLLQYLAFARYFIAFLPYNKLTKYNCRWYGSPYDCNSVNGYVKEGSYAHLRDDGKRGAVRGSADIDGPFPPTGELPSDEEV